MSESMDNKEFAEQTKKYEEWENSIEGIDYAVGALLYGETSKGDIRYRHLIDKTLFRLPKNIREKVLNGPIFIMLGDKTHGHIFKLKLYGEKTFIQLNFNAMKNRSDLYIMSTIAHEIANFILGHSAVESDKNAEKKADDLTEKWGFKRAYINYWGG